MCAEGSAPRGGNRTSSDAHAPPSRPANAAGGPRSEPTWSVGSWQLGAVRGSYVGTDAAPGQSGPPATFSPEDVSHRGPELHAAHGEPALDIACLCLFRFISLIYLCSSHLGTILSVQNRRFLKENTSVRKWKEKSARNVPTVVPDITSVNWGPRGRPKIWAQAPVGDEDSRSELLSRSRAAQGYAP